MNTKRSPDKIEKIRKIVLDNLDPWVIQHPGNSPLELYNIMLGMQLSGLSRFFLIGNTVVYGVFESPWIIDLHVFSNEKNAGGLIKNMKQFEDLIKNDYPTFRKLQFETYDIRWGTLAKRLNWKFEGIREKSFMTKDGSLINTYMYGKSL